MSHRLGAWAITLLALAGCQHMQTRGQSDEDDKDAEVKTIGDLTSVANAEHVGVNGVGLVVGLQGTGGGTVSPEVREFLEGEFRKRGVKNVKELLASPDNAIVMVSALVPPGCRKRAPLDVDIAVPPQSKTTSLRGGVLKECILYTYDSTRNLSENQRGDQLIRGEACVVAAGPVVVGMGEGDETVSLRQGRVWGGGRCLKDRGIFLFLNKDEQFARRAVRIAERINETFQGPYHGINSQLAEAKTKAVVNLKVPEQYRLNLNRFLRVVRLLPYQKSPDPGSPYRRKLAEQLLDPTRTVTTALRLEALGTDSIPVLKTGLQSEHALVRFASAEALAYLGDPACAEELGRLVEQPLLRAYCLTGLASLNEGVCQSRLEELMSSRSAETRYGAFRALHALEEDERKAYVPGEFLNHAFWIHEVAPDSTPLVALASSRRAEVVLFGEHPELEPPFSFLAGPEFTVTAAEGDPCCTVSRFSTEAGTKRRQCSLKVADVLRSLAELGATYPDAVELLRQADAGRCMNCRVACDALPTPASIHSLAEAGAANSDLLCSDEDVLRAREEIGALPTLFDSGRDRRRPRRPVREAATAGESPQQRR